ncbi:ankyrin repeat-containing protein At5g02620-like [Tasmannia lanceolata]|uniref:ankyrin repeat-containing protein At5g02620-like n=1 Tax=Tasmannia lanceolata TaxID=3420 RepID=UPI0040643D8B
METPPRQPNETPSRKKMAKQLTGKRDDTPLHSAARAGNLSIVKELLSRTDNKELNEFLLKQNQAGETALYVAAEYGYIDVVKELIKYHDIMSACIKAKNGYDAFHIAARQGDIEILKELRNALPELSMTVDFSNTTALHTAATQGYIEVVNLLLEEDGSLAKIARSNGKTALHSAARNGHIQVIKALLKDPGIATRTDKKGQTAFHMAVKGQNLELVEELLKCEPSVINMVDTKGNTPLHIATRKGRSQIVIRLLKCEGIDTKAINKAGETALDTAEKISNTNVATILSAHGVQSARALMPPNATQELKQTVSDIKHELHSQLKPTRQTRRQMQEITKRINKLHIEGLNNAINSTTVVAVLIATVAFAAIFTVPGQFADDPDNLSPGLSLGEANIAPLAPFMIFFVFDSVALFISLAVVVVQTSVVVIESKAKKQMMAIINKLMWFACVLISVAFLALSFIVVGDHERWLAVGATVIGTTILATTLGTMCYWVVIHRIEASKSNCRSIRKSSMSGMRSWSMSQISDSELMHNEYKKMYAI